MSTETTTTEVSGHGDDFYPHALLGAVVTVVTSIVPFSPLFGGAIAGYLYDEGTSRGTRVGAVSGAIAAIPLALLFVFILTVMSIGTIATGEIAGPVFVTLLIGTILLVVALYTVGLSAAGGYVGAAFAESQVETGTIAEEQ